MLKFWRLGAVALLFMAGTAYANDTASMREEIADLRSKVASMESAEMAPSAGGGVESLTSMKKNGAIKIGGKAEVGSIWIESDDSPTRRNGEDDEAYVYGSVTEFALKLEVQASADMKLNVKLDMEDADDADDLLEEVYFAWKNVGGSPIALNIGKKEVPFGQDNGIGWMEGMTHGGADLFAGNNDWFKNEGTTANTHAQVGDYNIMPGEIDNTYMIEAIYGWKDLLKLHLAVFDGDRAGTGPGNAQMYEDRPDDNFLFQSWATKLVVTPLEGLTLQASFYNRHNESNGGDEVANGDDDEKALSLAADYEFKGLPLEVWIEYIHGWDVNFDERLDSDTVSIGAIWGVTESIDLGILGEWCEIDGDRNYFYDEQEYWNLTMTAYYNFDNGMYVGAEYAHQWFDGDRRVGSDLDADADYFGLIMGYSF